MDIILKKREENKLYNRIEVEVEIEHLGEATPKREEVRNKIAAMMNHDVNLVVVKKILTYFGKNKSVAKVYLYKSKDDMFKLEPKYILKRNKIIQ